MIVSDERLDKAMSLLATTDLEFAERKGQVLRTEFMAKHAEALTYKALGSTGSVEDRKQEVRLSTDVKMAWDEHFQAVVNYENLKAQRERAVLVVELWRSTNANRRAGNVQ